MNKKKEHKNQKRGVARTFAGLLNGNFLTREDVIKHLPFLFFMAFLMIVYIGYGYYVEKTVKELYRVEAELKELKSEYITTKSELMYRSKQSQVAELTSELGIFEATAPPKKIVVEEK